MISGKHFISKEMQTYLLELLGTESYTGFIEKISTPMEDYTLHIYKDTSFNQQIVEVFEEHGFSARIHDQFDNLVVTQPKGPFKVDRTDESKVIVVDNRAAEMIYQGADIYIPGVKRANKVKKGDFVDVVNQNNRIVARAHALLDHNDMLSKRKGIAAKNIKSPYVVPNLHQLNISDVPAYFQSIPAYLVALNLEPKPQDRILDCCAAPGNKTLHLSELTEDKAKIIAVDRSANRIQKLQNKITQLKIKNITTEVGNIIDLSKEWSGNFDKILIDPPCSSLGLRPRLNINMNPEVFFDNSKYQKAIFFACDKLLKNRGTIIYSTCTVTKEENEDVIDYAINELNYQLEEQKIILSDYKLIKNHQFQQIQRFLPGKHKTLGYFIAKLKKK